MSPNPIKSTRVYQAVHAFAKHVQQELLRLANED